MKKLVLFCWFCLVALMVHAQTFTAKAPEQVEEGEVFRVQFVVTTDNPSAFKGPSFDSEGFELLAGPYTSSYSSYQIINGKSSSNSSVTYTYTVSARKKGTYTIPEAQVTVDGKKITSNKLTVKVVEGSGGNTGNYSRGGNAGNSGRDQVQTKDNGSISSSDLFITATASKTKVHEQEAILLTYKVYTLVNLTSLQPKMPDLKGFHVQEIDLPRNKVFSPENYKGRMYNTVVWSQYVLFPQQTGKITIPSITFEGVVAQRVRNLDPLDAFFNTGSAYTEVEKKIQTPAIEITVEPLPVKPANFSGAVGRFTLNSELSPKEVKSGEALTLKITVEGTGNMKLIKTPEVDVPKDFEVYDPKVTDNSHLTTSGMEGSKTFEFVYVPRNPGKYTIPSVPFIYYDLDSQSYKTLETPMYDLDIAKGKSTGNGGVNTYSKDEINVLDTDIRYIKTGNVALRQSDDDTYFGSLLNWMFYIIPILIFGVLSFMFRKQAMENANIALMRTKRANKMARKRLRTASQMLSANNKTAFYEEVMRALYGYVSDKLSIPVSALNKDNIREKLADRLSDIGLIQQLMEALDECEFARFAPAESGNSMAQFYEKVITIIEQVDNAIKK